MEHFLDGVRAETSEPRDSRHQDQEGQQTGKSNARLDERE
jgi:hypothetical protein